MKKSKSLQLIIPVIVLSMVSAACAFSFDLGGQKEIVDPTATTQVIIPTPYTRAL